MKCAIKMVCLIEKIEKHIEGMVRNIGYNIVHVSILGDKKNKILQIMIENIDDTPITIDDCETVSKLVATAIDIIEPIKGKYNLEISSPGINRPLIKPSDFIRFIGKDVIVKTYGLKADRKIFKGVLALADESGIKLELKDPSNEVIDFIYSEIKYAHIDGEKNL